jgi:hypothetical protein
MISLFSNILYIVCDICTNQTKWTDNCVESSDIRFGEKFVCHRRRIFQGWGSISCQCQRGENHWNTW